MSAISSTHVMIVIHNTLWLLNWVCRVPPISHILHPFIMNSGKNVNLPGVFELESKEGIRSISNNIDFSLDEALLYRLLLWYLLTDRKI